MTNRKKTEGLVLGSYTLPEPREEVGLHTFAILGKELAKYTGTFLSEYRQGLSDEKRLEPSEITIEFGVKIDVEGNVLRILRGGAEADIKLNLTWKGMSS